MERLEALLRVPSVSAVPDHAPDMERAAALVADEIRRAGGEAAVTATPRHPLVLGEVPASAGDGRAPRVVVYGHYDVQPPGPRSSGRPRPSSQSSATGTSMRAAPATTRGTSSC